ncbi:hypothetical protein KY284_023531 [Solanum tuberosum]|nr:hypothetical protein KY284_023531 [Solanum tuberosum]
MGDEHDHVLVATAQVGYVGAIRPLALIGIVTFNITSMILHLLGKEDLFGDLPLEDPNKHLKDLVGLCLANNLPHISQEGIKLRLFSFSKNSKATMWLGDLPEASITTWIELAGAFLERFFLTKYVSSLAMRSIIAYGSRKDVQVWKCRDS